MAQDPPLAPGGPGWPITGVTEQPRQRLYRTGPHGGELRSGRRPGERRMPYDPDRPDTWPEAVRRLPRKRARQWVHVWNSVYQRTGDEQAAYAAAWAAVKRAGKVAKAADAGDDADIVRWVTLPDGRRVPIRVPRGRAPGAPPCPSPERPDSSAMPEARAAQAPGAPRETVHVRMTVGDPTVIWGLMAASYVPNESEWREHALREMLQNSIDACREAMREGTVPRGRIEVEYKAGAEGELLAVDDNGIGMDLDTILNKFLTLGESTKEKQPRALGGFGTAKTVILGTADPTKGGQWRIRTREWEVTSDDVGREVQVSDLQRPFRAGCRIEVSGPEGSLRGLPDRLFALGLLRLVEAEDIDIVFNGKLVEPLARDRLARYEKRLPKNILDELPKGSSVRAYYLPEYALEALGLRWSLAYKTVVRINGLPTVWRSSYALDGLLLLDIETPEPPTVGEGPAKRPNPDYPLNPERTWLRDEFQRAFTYLYDALTEDEAAREPSEEEEVVYFQPPQTPEEKEAVGWATQRIADLNMRVQEAHRELGAQPPAEGGGSPRQIAEAVATGKSGTVSLGRPAVVNALLNSEAGVYELGPEDTPFIVVRRKDCEREFKPLEHLDLLVAWDLACRTILATLKAAEADPAALAAARVSPSELQEMPAPVPGFILDEGSGERGQTLAQTRIDDYGRRCVLLNPLPVLDELSKAPERVRSTVLADWLFDLAVHEMVHYLGVGPHSDKFAAVEAYMRGKLARSNARALYYYLTQPIFGGERRPGQSVTVWVKRHGGAEPAPGADD